ncbi:MAG: hypothetical protein GY851_26680 [bacterium]|nr:hypothetical protein [bacterium]
MPKLRSLALVFAWIFAIQPAFGAPVIEPGFHRVLRRPGGVPEECFPAYLAAVGTLYLDATLHDPDAPALRLDFNGEGRLLDATASSLTVEIPAAGNVEVCASADDPRRLLADYKLHVVFTNAVEVKDGDPMEEEIDPDPLRFVPEHDGCATDDDHGNVRGCATPLDLDAEVHAELLNQHFDDEDTFAVFVGEGERPAVEITIDAGMPGLVGEIYDVYGHRLAFAIDDGDGVRMVKTLVGTAIYYVRVHGGVDRVSGGYRLTLKEVKR